MSTRLYQWGILYDHQTRRRIKCHQPVEMPMKQQLNGSLEQIACGTNFTIVLHSNCRVLVIGDEPKHGRLGLGDETTLAPMLTYISGVIPPIVFISCGPATSILLTRDRREIWAFGKGVGSSPTLIYQSQQEITHCACNQNCIIVVIDGSRIEERRFNRTGFINEWTRVYQIEHNNDRIRHLDVGSSLNGFVSELGHIFLWGSNVPKGKGTTEEHFINVSITNPYQKDLITDRPVQISCSRGQFHSHALLLTEQGVIYAIGSNYKGKLGVEKKIVFTDEWLLVHLSSPCSFKMVAAGGIHSSALSLDGKVFTWGCGSDGRLGHSESEGHRYLYKESEPRPIENFHSGCSTTAATSYYHMAAIIYQ